MAQRATTHSTRLFEPFVGGANGAHPLWVTNHDPANRAPHTVLKAKRRQRIADVVAGSRQLTSLPQMAALSRPGKPTAYLGGQGHPYALRGAFSLGRPKSRAYALGPGKPTVQGCLSVLNSTSACVAVREGRALAASTSWRSLDRAGFWHSLRAGSLLPRNFGQQT